MVSLLYIVYLLAEFVHQTGQFFLVFAVPLVPLKHLFISNEAEQDNLKTDVNQVGEALVNNHCTKVDEYPDLRHKLAAGQGVSNQALVCKFEDCHEYNKGSIGNKDLLEEAKHVELAKEPLKPAPIPVFEIVGFDSRISQTVSENCHLSLAQNMGTW